MTVNFIVLFFYKAPLRRLRLIWSRDGTENLWYQHHICNKIRVTYVPTYRMLVSQLARVVKLFPTKLSFMRLLCNKFIFLLSLTPDDFACQREAILGKSWTKGLMKTPVSLSFVQLLLTTLFFCSVQRRTILFSLTLDDFIRQTKNSRKFLSEISMRYIYHSLP